MDLLTGFFKGGLLMWPILICSIISVAIIIQKYFLLRSIRVNVSTFMIQLRDYMKRGDIVQAMNFCSAHKTPIANILKRGLSKYKFGVERVKESIEYSGRQEIYELEKGLSVLATIAGVAPLFGFLGTVTGMISAFFTVQVLAGNATPSDLAGGVWEALMTTAFGLGVGIPSYIFYNYFVSRVTKMVMDMETASIDLIDILYEENLYVASK